MAEVFYMPAAPARSLWVLLLVIALVVLPLVLLSYIATSGRTTRYELTENGLSIRGTLYGRTIRWSDIHAGEIRAVNLSQEHALQPRLRTNGIGLPGYQAGWFRLREGGRGLLFVTDRSRVVVVPTTLGYTLLVSVTEPESFLERARSLAG